MPDRIIRGTADKGEIRFFLTDCTEIVQKTTEIHKLSVSNSYVLGKFICAGLLMSAGLKSENDVLTISTTSDKISGRMVVTVNSRSEIKAYMFNPEYEPDPASEKSGGSIDSIVLGKGTINVIKDMGLKAPYAGQVEMKYGSVAEDLVHYFAVSEQIPTSISLGVLIDDSGKVQKAGGFLLQMMPGHSEDTVRVLEKSIYSFPNFTDVLDMNYDLEKIASDILLKDLGPVFKGEIIPRYKCGCSRKKMQTAAQTLEKKEIKEILEKDGYVEVKCHFCNRKYRFTEKDFGKN